MLLYGSSGYRLLWRNRNRPYGYGIFIIILMEIPSCVFMVGGGSPGVLENDQFLQNVYFPKWD